MRHYHQLNNTDRQLIAKISISSSQEATLQTNQLYSDWFLFSAVPLTLLIRCFEAMVTNSGFVYFSLGIPFILCPCVNSSNGLLNIFDKNCLFTYLSTLNSILMKPGNLICGQIFIKKLSFQKALLSKSVVNHF